MNTLSPPPLRSEDLPSHRPHEHLGMAQSDVPDNLFQALRPLRTILAGHSCLRQGTQRCSCHPLPLRCGEPRPTHCIRRHLQEHLLFQRPQEQRGTRGTRCNRSTGPCQDGIAFQNTLQSLDVVLLQRLAQAAAMGIGIVDEVCQHAPDLPHLPATRARVAVSSISQEVDRVNGPIVAEVLWSIQRGGGGMLWKEEVAYHTEWQNCIANTVDFARSHARDIARSPQVLRNCDQVQSDVASSCKNGSGGCELGLDDVVEVDLFGLESVEVKTTLIAAEFVDQSTPVENTRLQGKIPSRCPRVAVFMLCSVHHEIFQSLNTSDIVVGDRKFIEAIWAKLQATNHERQYLAGRRDVDF